MGVLNSWEKLLIKSDLSISVFSSSCAILLKLSVTSESADIPLAVFPKLNLAVKSPEASLFIEEMIRLKGLRGNLTIIIEIPNQITRLINARNKRRGVTSIAVPSYAGIALKSTII